MKHLNLIKLSFAFIISMIIGLSVSGQSTEPAAASGYLGDDQEFWDNIPHLILSPESESTELPTEVDNSVLMYFPRTIIDDEIWREIYIQDGNGACVGVATVHYTLTYELNRVRELYGLPLENKYPANFTWNFLNFGIYNHGSGFTRNFDILKTNGCPNGVEWGVWNPADYTRWMHGYDKYISSYQNRIESLSGILPMYNTEKHTLMKHWLADHNEGAETGGLIVFSTEGACTGDEILPPESAHAGDVVVVEWDTACDHAMTIVGYCDDVMWDFNEDGQFTNYIDLDNNGVIDVRDWEIGAFIVVGLGHYDYAQEGFVWVMYKTIAECTNLCGIVEHVDDGYYEPLIEIKGELIHNKRDNLKVRMARGLNANSTPLPTNTTAWKNSIFLNDGGSFPMQGIGNDPWLEFFLNYGYYFSQLDFGKIFLEVKSGNSEAGTLVYWTLVDRRWGEVFELDYPETNINLPVNTDLIFELPYHLIPHETYIEEDLLLFSDMVSRFNPTVGNGATLTVEDGVQIDMYESEIHINQGSSLVLEDNVTILAKKGICKIVIDGNASIGSNVNFIAEEDAQLQLIINNTNIDVTMDYAHFTGSALIAYNDELTVTHSDFTNSGIYGFNGDFDISNTEFISSFVNISNADADNRLVSITGNFSGMQSTTAIDIDNYPNFKIDNCMISECSSAIDLFNCGYGKKYQQVSNCDITGNINIGITVYNTSVDILHNEIIDNSYGIRCLDRSQVHIEGDNNNVTQEIKDNDSYEVFATRGSFPHYFHWNLVQDDDNLPGDPLVKYTGQEDGLDVRNNCWGNNFNPEDDLAPYESYVWEPVWECMSGSGSGDGSEAEGMYLAARGKIVAEDYAGAKADFLQIVNLYPTSKYSQASLKELYSIEAFVSNDYAELKTYYNSEPNITNNPELTKLADFLANFCEIKLENWPTAIAWFEDVIQNPESLEDSIFAIIDLGYTYFLMENGGFKSAYVGNMAQYKPVSRKQFEGDRDYLLSLLPGDELSKTMKESLGQLKSGELLQNIPNPFNGSTQIYYKLEEAAAVNINVYSYTGQLIKTYNEGMKTGGVHYVEFFSEALPAGIYFYSIKVNGKTSDSKKMTVVR
ncbi:MAG: T9SS type A sorting domain-containing protein [Bacteroidales bacterium]|nr:T9SS type A sorting domain-containing protein [Bacteroidales bacterium]